jgi:hypothetical protein
MCRLVATLAAVEAGEQESAQNEQCPRALDSLAE